MRIKCIGCDALARLIYLCAANSPHLIDVSLFRLGLHRKPEDLRARLQQAVDAASAERMGDGKGYDAIALVYGLCGRATAGITARNIPVVIPRAHDCITLFLGSRQRYQEQQEQTPGTYWYVQDYIERGSMDGQKTVLGAGVDDAGSIEDVYDSYVEKYGKDNADYLMEVMGAWRSHYERAAFIDMGVGESSRVEAQAREEAQRRGWQFERVPGNFTLIRRLLEGDWDGDFAILQPGQRLEMSYDDDIIRGENG